VNSPEPSPEGKAAAEEAQRLILAALAKLKRRQRRYPEAVTSAICHDVGLRTAYEQAVANNDQAMVDGLRFSPAGFLGSFMEGRSRLATTPMLAVLLTNQDRAIEGPWCQGILEAMHEAGLVQQPPPPPSGTNCWRAA
jgi:hypothetical protein